MREIAPGTPLLLTFGAAPQPDPLPVKNGEREKHASGLTHYCWVHHSKTNVSSMVTRYSAIFPLVTLAFCSTT